MCAALSTAQLEPPEEQKKRFEIECEFVQSLANPNYLNFLAQRGYFKEDYFINYLRYLQYWKRPEYARALKYPQCLHFLEALQTTEFREALQSGANAKYIEDQQVLQWQYYLRKRQRLQVNPPTEGDVKDEPDDSSEDTEEDDKMDTAENGVGPKFLLVLSIFTISTINATEVDPPTVCETCFLLAKELQYASSRIHTYSESDFIDATESICNNFMHYKIHKDKTGVHRFAKHESETMKTLKELKDRGVKVELGMPYEMWDQPTAEVSLLKQKCEQIMSDYEDELTEWFISKSKTPLMTFLCIDRVVRPTEASCLSESHSEL